MGAFTKENPSKRHQLHAGGRILHPRPEAAGGKPPYRTVGPDAQDVFCKNTGPASTTPCFCRENSGHILLT